LKRIWQWRSAVIALAIVPAAVTAHRLMPALPSARLDELIHSLHGPGFALIAVLLFFIFGPQRQVLHRYIAAGGTAFAIGLISEAAQIPGPRDAQIIDLVVDGIGIYGPLALFAIFSSELALVATRGMRTLIGLSGLLAFGATFAPTLWYGYALYAQQAAMPAVLTFEEPWESETYRQTEHRNPETVLAPGNWPDPESTVAFAKETGKNGILIQILPDPDWRGYRAVSFIAASTSDTTHAIDVDLRDMHTEDERHSTRLKTRILVGPEVKRHTIAFENMITIRGDGPLDPEHIESLTLSASIPGDDVAIFVDDFRLE
jgi:hypothetical protein